ncbi:beta-1,3-galactosyltransferase 5-like [Oppia nitens]|uniref:beta-1,3-galactosyltransferase 5-like n=1 Tax=Oppia nitens TaxID=1686743 RepID=UPI0023D97C3B|nr:beta-1,3-galactosyltransferase 5-like [Oppia nitens]
MLRKSVNQSVSINKSTYRSPHWKLLSDGTVTHLGSNNSSDNPFDKLSYHIRNDQICDNIIIKDKIIIIFIESETINFHRRLTIRQTWAQRQLQNDQQFKVVFVLGLPSNRKKTDGHRHPHPVESSTADDIQDKINEENEMFADIIQINLGEDFQHLTHKSMASIKWFLDWCPFGYFYFKTDDDIMIYTKNLVGSVREFMANDDDNKVVTNSMIFCRQNPNRKIIRSFEKVSQMMTSYRRRSANRHQLMADLIKKLLKYKINYSQLPGLYYPSYCSGFGYGFSRPVADKLYRTALTIPYLQIEDVFVTGLTRQKANIGIKNTDRLTLRPLARPSTDTVCSIFGNNGRITSSELTPQQMRQIWTNNAGAEDTNC